MRQENASQQESLYGLVNAYTSAAQKIARLKVATIWKFWLEHLAEYGVASFAPQRAFVFAAFTQTNAKPMNDEDDEPFDVVETAREMFEAQVISRTPRKEVVRIMTQSQKHCPLRCKPPRNDVERDAAQVLPDLSAPVPLLGMWTTFPSIPTSPLVFGRALHDALCFVHERQMQNGKLPSRRRSMLERFDALWSEAFKAQSRFFETVRLHRRTTLDDRTRNSALVFGRARKPDHCRSRRNWRLKCRLVITSSLASWIVWTKAKVVSSLWTLKANA